MRHPAVLLSAIFCSAIFAAADDSLPSELLTHGPIVGHVNAGSAKIWGRAAQPGVLELSVFDEDRNLIEVIGVEALEGNDNCVVWQVDSLDAATDYHYAIGDGRNADATLGQLGFTTAPAPGEAAKVRIAFASCAHHRRFPSQPAWTQIVEQGADVIVSLGDTPYIDSTDLTIQRQRYQELYQVPELRAALARTPFIGVWDDHDFGKNDVNGMVAGKEYARQAFMEYHANPSYGDGRHNGVYTRFRWGPVEVFLLDTRWFAGLFQSHVDPQKKTLLGRQQWKWLTRELTASDAPFKLLASGMVWNGAVRPKKTDYWMAYAHERDALFRFIGEQNISGVVLVGGDIHRSRALRFPTEDTAGYALTELISSPIANRVIESANVDTPELLYDVGDEQSFMLVTVDTTEDDPRLEAKCMNHDGTVHFTVELSANELRRSDSQSVH